MHVSTLCPLWPRLQTLSSRCPPYVRFGPLKTSAAVCLSGLVSASPCICLVSALAAPPSIVSPMLPSVSAPCLFFVLSLSARCSLFIRSLSVFGRVYDLALAGPLSALCLFFGFCAFVRSVSRSLWLRFCPLFVWSPAVLLSALKLGRAFAPCLSFSPFVCVCLCPDLYTKLGHAVSL